MQSKNIRQDFIRLKSALREIYSKNTLDVIVSIELKEMIALLEKIRIDFEDKIYPILNSPPPTNLAKLLIKPQTLGKLNCFRKRE